MIDEWVAKAEDDYQAATALNRRRKDPIPDIVCYHCAQCLEKYLKAFLVQQGIVPPLIHDLPGLLVLGVVHDPRLVNLNPLLLVINPYAVRVRYPGYSTTTLQAAEALDITRQVRRRLRRTLGL
jgi:HEPN domain-containing protein